MLTVFEIYKMNHPVKYSETLCNHGLVAFNSKMAEISDFSEMVFIEITLHNISFFN